MAFSALFGFGSCHGEGIGVSTEGIGGVSVGTSIGVTSISTSIGSMGVGRVGTVGTIVVGIGVSSVGTSIGSMGVGRVGTVVVGIGVSSNGYRGDSGGSDNGFDNMSRLNSGENRGNGECDSARSVGIKDRCVSSLSLSNLG